MRIIIDNEEIKISNENYEKRRPLSKRNSKRKTTKNRILNSEQMLNQELLSQDDIDVGFIAKNFTKIPEYTAVGSLQMTHYSIIKIHFVFPSLKTIIFICSLRKR